ncbi:hypothetical protein O5P60_002656 [Vibrio parahaemolyticus]|nr:hypothetical protein [Vibrio parahaemolyticus]EKG9663397.1 hypothetical protein [Vibrio parahaemolyticus]EKG9668977.1 hypothetical protein [Vibrio parahaemolyticus]
MAEKEMEYQGCKGIKSISTKFGIAESTLRQRLSKGMSLKDAIETKVKNRGQAKKKIVEKPEVELVGIKAPDQLNNSWKLALGMGGSL